MVNVTLNFNSSTPEQSVHFTTIDDSIVEDDEIIILELSVLNSSISTEVSNPAGVIVIIDDDTTVETLKLQQKADEGVTF